MRGLLGQALVFTQIELFVTIYCFIKGGRNSVNSFVFNLTSNFTDPKPNPRPNLIVQSHLIPSPNYFLESPKKLLLPKLPVFDALNDPVRLAPLTLPLSTGPESTAPAAPCPSST